MELMTQPQAPGLGRATLVDLLDRVLDRGLVINADIIISLAGVPLVGISLRAALADMETMVKYGLLKEWDQSIRARELRIRETLQPVVREEVLLERASLALPLRAYPEPAEGTQAQKVSGV